VYDVTDANSYDKVKQWIVELRKFLPLDVPILIAGNKCDLPNKVIDTEDAEV
jgi:GTPase SAR1 family protein